MFHPYLSTPSNGPTAFENDKPWFKSLWPETASPSRPTLILITGIPSENVDCDAMSFQPFDRARRSDTGGTSNRHNPFLRTNERQGKLVGKFL